MSRGRSGPRQPGGGRQNAGPRSFRGKSRSLPSPRAAVGRVGGRAERSEPGWGEWRSLTEEPPPTPDPSPSRALRAGGGEKQIHASGVQTLTVSPDESGMRVDRFFEA